MPELRRWSGILNGLAQLLFLVVTVLSLRERPPDSAMRQSQAPSRASN